MIQTFRILSIFIISSLIGCSSPGHFPKTKGLSQSNSFGFIENGNQYYFALRQIKRKDKICNSYVGFKDGDKIFKFNSSHFIELDGIYNQQTPPEERISLALKKIEEFHNLSPKENCYKEGHWSEGAVWIGIALAVWPVTLILGGIQVVDQATNKMDDIYLGMTFNEMKKVIEVYQLRSRTQDNHTYYVVDKGTARMVMFFKNDKLMAYVRGGNPDYYKQHLLK